MRLYAIGGLVIVLFGLIAGVGVAGEKAKNNKPQVIEYTYPTGNEQK